MKALDRRNMVFKSIFSASSLSDNRKINKQTNEGHGRTTSDDKKAKKQKFNNTFQS